MQNSKSTVIEEEDEDEEGLTNQLYFVTEIPVFTQNFRFIVHMDVRYGPHYNVLLELIIICYTRSKRVNGKIICLCTSSDENLFPFKF